jgi:hypothetical protein
MIRTWVLQVMCLMLKSVINSIAILTSILNIFNAMANNCRLRVDVGEHQKRGCGWPPVDVSC